MCVCSSIFYIGSHVQTVIDNITFYLFSLLIYLCLCFPPHFFFCCVFVCCLSLSLSFGLFVRVAIWDHLWIKGTDTGDVGLGDKGVTSGEGTPNSPTL